MLPGDVSSIIETAGVALGDLDGDRDLDAFVGSHCGEGAHVWLNDGVAGFSDSGQNLTGLLFGQAFHLFGMALRVLLFLFRGLLAILALIWLILLLLLR